MLNVAEIYAVIEERRELLGLSQSEVGRRALGQNSGAALQNMKRGSSPTIENLSLICDVLGLDIQIGPRRAVHGNLAESEGETDFEKPSPGRMGYLPMPWAQPGLGKGSAPISIQRDYLDQLGLVPDRLSAVIPDTVLLDLPFSGPFVALIDARMARRDHGLWCFVEGGKTVIAHLTFVADGLVVAGQRPADPARLIASAAIPTFGLLGKVVWLAALCRL